MLLLVLLLTSFSKRSNLALGSILVDPRAQADSCDDIHNCRLLFDIVWGSLTTIFACTWVSVHPNVPPPHLSQALLLRRRLRMMFVAVIAPELMVGFAARQLCAARLFAGEFGVSIKHGFFISMGGFVSRNGHHPIATMKQLEATPEYLDDIRYLDVADITDRSKGDALAKGVALAQGLWFTAQCIARVNQGLPVTELEVATLAFAVLNVFIWSIWWHKPLDVQRAIPIGPDDVLDAVLLPPQPWYRRLLRSIIIGAYPDFHPASATAVPSFWSMEHDRPRASAFVLSVSNFTEGVVGAVFGSIHCAAWNAHFPTAAERWVWRACAAAVAAIPAAMVFVPASRFLGVRLLKRVFPTLWKLHWAGWHSDSLDTLAWVIISICSPIYVLGRLFLIVLPLATLRALQPGVFVDVDWSVYIPHL
ncbi:hypothetical protein B0H15DRAFT_948642 [Mycena belliarum]|uniref:Uncharacterized protein n=1 Tax=Mycena belliarum TaxID=1033014 RepID=A0AAD6XVL0_9AGAR|nr:hypothetical protein B0H15DRAFT_948642 [Mycena belliae]